MMELMRTKMRVLRQRSQVLRAKQAAQRELTTPGARAGFCLARQSSVWFHRELCGFAGFVSVAKQSSSADELPTGGGLKTTS